MLLGLDMGVEMGVEVGVTAFTLTRVLVIVVVAYEVVSPAATSWAVARQRREVTRAPNCMLPIKEIAEEGWLVLAR